jgi:Flp pilus assembly protein CpaB
MRRGRIFIYLALIVIIVVAAGAYYLWSRRSVNPQASETTATPEARNVEIITAGQNIYPGTPITEAMLSSIQIPEGNLIQGIYTSKTDLVNMYAKFLITQGVPITDAMVSITPGNVNLPGSYWAPFIPQGLTAVSIPITRLSAAAYGIRGGDFVNVIVTMLLVDVDPALQSVLPNTIAGLEQPGDNPGIIKITQGDVIQGHFEMDETSQVLMYVQPSEKQRARLVTQMIMQNIQVLQVGTFPLPGETVTDQTVVSASGEATSTPDPAALQQVAAVIIRPDIITLMVTPQDAVMLTYLVYSGAEITLTLRNPNDQTPGSQPDAGMLEYLLTQYNIPVPAKLPYSIEPRLDVLMQPKLPNDVIATPVP